MSRIEEFERDGKHFIYFDLSGFGTNDAFLRIIEESEPIVGKYANMSLYTITNIEGVKFDTKTKKVVAKWMEYNKPYVKYGVLIGVDGIKKIMVEAIFALSGRKNMSLASAKEEAVAWLLRQD